MQSIKKIHYCWFGGNPKPELVQKCIDSWRTYCPDYEIIEWNESNFDVHCCNYVEQAYELKKWAFVSDYCRFWVLYNNGGIYLDTDVELLKSLSELPQSFVGYEEDTVVSSGLIRGALPGDELCKKMLDSYESDTFLTDDGNLNLMTVCHRETNFFKELGLRCDNTMQVIGDTTIFPKDWFSPKDYYTEKIKITENTHSIHHYLKSWTKAETKKQAFLRKHRKINAFIHIPNKVLKFLLGEKNYKKIKKVFGR